MPELKINNIFECVYITGSEWIIWQAGRLGKKLLCLFLERSDMSLTARGTTWLLLLTYLFFLGALQFVTADSYYSFLNTCQRMGPEKVTCVLVKNYSTIHMASFHIIRYAPQKVCDRYNFNAFFKFINDLDYLLLKWDLFYQI